MLNEYSFHEMQIGPSKSFDLRAYVIEQVLRLTLRDDWRKFAYLVGQVDFVKELFSLSVDSVVHVAHVGEKNVHGVVTFRSLVNVSSQVAVERHSRFGSGTAHLFGSKSNQIKSNQIYSPNARRRSKQ